MPDLQPETWELVDRRVRTLQTKLDEIERYRQARTYAPLHAAVEKMGTWAGELAETIVQDILGQIDPRVLPKKPCANGDMPQVSLSDAQLAVLQYVHDADKPIETSASSNFAAGWVSGSVAAALVRKGMLRYLRTGLVEATAGGCSVLAQYQ